MYNQAGEKYVRSNKFKASSWIIALAAAFFASIGIGRLYAIITLINPIIYLNFLVLVGAVLLLMVVIMLVKSFGKSRNRTVDIVTCLVVCSTAWLAHWAHIESADSSEGFWSAFADIPRLLGFPILFAGSRNLSVGRFGSRGVGIDPAILTLCYIIEFVAFMAPAYLSLKSKDYYCEDCDNSYQSVTCYLAEDEVLHQHSDQMKTGDLVFLEGRSLYRNLDQLPLDPKEKPGIGTIEFHYCNKCNAGAIVNIKAGILKQGDKKKREVSKENSLVEDTFITDNSRKFIASGLGLA
jgi:hypothetical protein